MTEEGKVVSVNEDFATVRVDKKSSCDKCGLCLFKDNVKHTDINAYNKCKAEVGDKVVIENNENLSLIGALLVFLVPLVLIGVSTAITYLIGLKEIWILIFSVIFIIMWYTIVSLIDKKFAKKKKFIFKVIKIIKEK